MEATFYIGALELHLEEGVITHFQDLDETFLTQAMPAAKRAVITAGPVDELDIPEGPFRTLGTRRVWNQNGKEYRLYNPEYGMPYIMSIRDGMNVHIRILRDRWYRCHNSMRPWFHTHIEELLLENDALILHSAGIIVNGRAILFSAPSGTGKTTQTDLWHRYAKDEVIDLNGDRAVLQKTADGWMACGFPIYGSVKRCNQCAVPIESIVMIRQSPTDRVSEMSDMEKFSQLYSQVTVPSADVNYTMRAMDLLEEMTRNVRIIQLDCTMNESAVRTLEHYLYGESNHGTL